jgi:hypothetical protein
MPMTEYPEVTVVSRAAKQKETPMDTFTKYRRTQIAEMRPYVKGEALDPHVSVSAVDREAGSPKDGDMIARNPANHADQWLVAADYFAANFEPIAGEKCMGLQPLSSTHPVHCPSCTRP